MRASEYSALRPGTVTITEGGDDEEEEGESNAEELLEAKKASFGRDGAEAAGEPQDEDEETTSSEQDSGALRRRRRLTEPAEASWLSGLWCLRSHNRLSAVCLALGALILVAGFLYILSTELLGGESEDGDDLTPVEEGPSGDGESSP